MRLGKKAVTFIVRASVLGICGIISAFLLLTGYESVYNRDVPLVHSLDAINLAAYQSRYELAAHLSEDAKTLGNFGKPVNLKMPQRSMRFDIVKPIEDLRGDRWLARASTLHLVPLSEARGGNLGVALLYCRSSFRTINSQNLPKSGDNIFVDTDRNWRYVYRVQATKALPDTEPYILSDSGTKGKLIVSCNDHTQKRNYIIEAEQLVVQGVEQ